MIIITVANHVSTIRLCQNIACVAWLFFVCSELLLAPVYDVVF